MKITATFEVVVHEGQPQDEHQVFYVFEHWLDDTCTDDTMFVQDDEHEDETEYSINLLEVTR